MKMKSLGTFLDLNWVQKLILIGSIQNFVNPNMGALHVVSNPFL